MPNRNPARSVIAAVLLTALCTLTACASFRGAIRDVHNDDMIGKLAPELAGGEWIGSSRYVPASTKYHDWTVIAFFRPWNTACAEDVPALAKLQRDYHDRGVRVLAVTEAPPERALEFITEHSVSYPVLTDAQASQDEFGVELLWGTEVLLVDPGGIVIADRLADIERILSTELGTPLTDR